MPSNLEIYKYIHKGQRLEMFKIAELAGQAEPQDEQGLMALNSRILRFREGLRHHAHVEEEIIHPVLSKRVPGGTLNLEEDHLVMNRQLDDIVALVDVLLNAPASSTESKYLYQGLYLSWNRFVAFYLLHIDTEEEQARPELWRLCSDPDVKGMFNKPLAAETPEQLAFDLSLMLPAINRIERVELLQSLSGPYPELLGMFNDISKRTLSPEDYAELRSKCDLP